MFPTVPGVVEPPLPELPPLTALNHLAVPLPLLTVFPPLPLANPFPLEAPLVVLVPPRAPLFGAPLLGPPLLGAPLDVLGAPLAEFAPLPLLATLAGAPLV